MITRELILNKIFIVEMFYCSRETLEREMEISRPSTLRTVDCDPADELPSIPSHSPSNAHGNLGRKRSDKIEKNLNLVSFHY